MFCTTRHTMKTSASRFGIGLLFALAACSSSSPNRVVNAAHTATGETITTGNTGQAVSADAHARFSEAATAMRTHDDANSGRGDWSNDTCTSIAGQFEAAAQQQPNQAFAEAWFDRGLVFDRCGMTDQARQSFQRAIDVSNGNYCRAKVQLGVMAYRAHDAGAAQQMFSEAIRQDPTHCVEGYSNLAMVLRERNPSTDQEWGEVVRNIRAALALDDRYLPARNQLALAYLQQAGDDPNSQRIFLAGLVCSQAIQVGSQQAENLTADVRSHMADLFATWGIIDIRRNEIIKALDHFHRATTLNPNMFEAWVNYGTINLSFRGYQDAREAFQHAVELRADSYEAHNGLGVALRGLAQSAPEGERPNLINQAQTEYERARTIDQNRPDVYYNLGVLNMSYRSGSIAELNSAREFLTQFVTRAGSQPRQADAVTRAQRYIRNINDTVTAMQGAGASPTPAATPPAEGATPPAGATPTAPPATTPTATPAGAPAAPAAAPAAH